MDKHVKFICRSANDHIRALRHVRSITSAEVANNIACIIVGARLDYCNSFLLGASKTNIVKLQRLQNLIARVVTRSQKFDSITHVLKRLHWLPIPSSITYKMVLLTYKTLQAVRSGYLSSPHQLHEPTRALLSSARQCLTVPEGIRTAFASRFFELRSSSTLEQSST